MRNWLIGAGVLAVVAVIAFFLLGGSGEEGGFLGGEPTPTLGVLPPVTASDSVVAEGEVVPVRNVELRFESNGTISEILVAEGDAIRRDEVIARLDARDLQLAVEQAEANLTQAQANLELLLDGATDAEVAAAQAQVADAEAALQQARAAVAINEADVARSQADVTSRQADVAARGADVSRSQAEVARAGADLQRTLGSVTPQDIAAAEADIEEARETLRDLEDGPDAVDVQTARAALDEARATLQSQRDSLSAAKTNAELAERQAANTLRTAQAEYSQIYWEIQEIERELNRVRQTRWQELKDREEAALREVENAEATLAQAQVDVETARRAEVTGIQVAEARLADAQARYNDVLEGAQPDELAAARARLANTEANLSRLIGQQRAGEIAAAEASISSAQASVAAAEAAVAGAQANVQAAQAGVGGSQANVQSSQAGVSRAEADVNRQTANFDDLTAPPRPAEVKDREAVVQQNEVRVRQAQRDLEKAVLLSPIDGSIIEMNLEVGERVDTSTVAVRVADLTEWEVETTDLTELGVVRVEIGDPAILTFDALPGLELNGTVKSIQEIGVNRQGDIVYKVTISPQEWDPRLRWGMTATVSIEPQGDGITDNLEPDPTTTPTDE